MTQCVSRLVDSFRAAFVDGAVPYGGGRRIWPHGRAPGFLWLLEAGARVPEIAGRLGRATGGSAARLVKPGGIEPPAGIALRPARGVGV